MSKAENGQSVNFYNPLPYYVEHNGKLYRLTPAFDNVLNMYDSIDGLTDAEQLDVMLYYLTDNAPKDIDLLKKVINVFFPHTDKKSTEKHFDFLQDSQLIYAAFYQAYGIDLATQLGKMHWWTFQALFNGLPNDTRFCQVVGIRAQKMPAPTKHNAEQRAELMRLKAEYKLRKSEEERQRDVQEGLAKIAQFLISKAEG